MSSTQEDPATISRRRRPRRRSVIVAAVLAVLCGAAVIGVATANDDASPAGMDPTRTDPAELLGTWRPILIKGDTELSFPHLKAPTVTFAVDSRWHGSDGCNAIGGKYDADPGEISVESGPETMIWCHNVPHDEVLAKSAHFRINGTALALYDDNWNQLASYARIQ